MNNQTEELHVAVSEFASPSLRKRGASWTIIQEAVQEAVESDAPSVYEKVRVAVQIGTRKVEDREELEKRVDMVGKDLFRGRMGDTFEEIFGGS